MIISNIKMSTGKDLDTVFILLLVFIFLTMSGIISTQNMMSIEWTKYRIEAESSDVGCSPSDTLFIIDDVPDLLSCNRICFIDNGCVSGFFQPEHHQCIGCKEYIRYQPSNAPNGFVHFSDRKFDYDCKEIFDKDNNAKSGVYKILPRNYVTLQVYCDMDTDGGGWTVFQNRVDGSVSFENPFSAYEDGFGDLDGEFWLGLRHIQELTETPSEMRYEIHSPGVGVPTEKYAAFRLVGPNYTLAINETPVERSDFRDGHSDTFARFNGADFSTFDHGDMASCAENYSGGWWYTESECSFKINLNMLYGSLIFTGDEEYVGGYLLGSKMMLRKLL